MDNFWEERRFAEVVGVVGDVRYRDLSSEPQPKVYFPYSQRPFRMQYGGQLVVESSDGDPTSVVGTVRAAVERIEPDIPVEFATQTRLVGESLAERRFTMSLLGGFSLIALMLAGVGVYGVVSYTVARRTREMGIRLALGAPPAGVLRLIVSGSMRPVLGGVIAGVAVALVGVRALESLLYGVDARDPLTFLGVVVVLSATGLLASWIPARMGMRVDPNVTMRAE
jgi:ABC-type antimicrobial peptide transport system permease subunit